MDSKHYDFNYNSDIKNDFIKSRADLSAGFFSNLNRTMFNIDKYETKVSKSILDFNIDEIKDMLSEIATSSNYASLGTTLLSANFYLDYCADKGLINENLLRTYNIKDCDIDLTKGVNISLVKDPKELVEIIGKHFPTPITNSVYNSYILASMLYYLGVQPKDIFNIKKEDYSPIKKTLTFNGIEYTIPKEFCARFSYALRQEFVVVAPDYWENGRISYYNNPDCLIGVYGKVASKERAVRNFKVSYTKQIINTLPNEYAKKFTAKNLNKSGFFYKTYINEKITLENVSFRNGIKMFLDAKGIDNNCNYYINYKNRTMVQEYNCWKKTFYNE